MDDGKDDGELAGLTEAQRALLGLETIDLSDEALAAVDCEIEMGRAEADDTVVASSLSLQEAAQRTGRTERALEDDPNVYTVATRRATRILPAWQFSGNAVVQGVGEVVATLPSRLHPLEVGKFMTGPSDELDGRSPVGWLAQGGPVGAVVALADALAWE